MQGPTGFAADRPAARTFNKGQRTAARILDAAETLFAQRGYDATSLRDIATAAEIQQPGLYKHFESKEALYREVYRRALQPLADVMEERVRSVSEHGHRALTDRLVDMLAERPNAAMLLIRSIIVPGADQDAVGREWIERLLDYGRRISNAAGVKPDTDAVALDTVAMLNILFGYFWAAPLISGLSGTDPFCDAMIARQKDLLADFILAMGAGVETSAPRSSQQEEM